MFPLSKKVKMNTLMHTEGRDTNWREEVVSFFTTHLIKITLFFHCIIIYACLNYVMKNKSRRCYIFEIIMLAYLLCNPVNTLCYSSFL
jgi:hypothetical protein